MSEGAPVITQMDVTFENLEYQPLSWSLDVNNKIFAFSRELHIDDLPALGLGYVPMPDSLVLNFDTGPVMTLSCPAGQAEIINVLTSPDSDEVIIDLAFDYEEIGLYDQDGE